MLGLGSRDSFVEFARSVGAAADPRKRDQARLLVFVQAVQKFPELLAGCVAGQILEDRFSWRHPESNSNSLFVVPRVGLHVDLARAENDMRHFIG